VNFFVNLVIFAEKPVAALVAALGVVDSKLHLLQPSSVRCLTNSWNNKTSVVFVEW